MRQLILAALLTLSTTAVQAEAPYPPELADAQMVAEMIDDSELIYCIDNICHYVLDGQYFPTGVDEMKNGYVVIFPEGKYSAEDREKYAPQLTEFWQTMVAMRNDNCTSPRLSDVTKAKLGCNAF